MLTIGVNCLILAISLWVVARKEADFDTSSVLKAVVGIAIASFLLNFLSAVIQNCAIFIIYLILVAGIVWRICYCPVKQAIMVTGMFGVLSLIASAVGGYLTNPR